MATESRALVLAQPSTLDFTAEETEIIRNQYANGATEAEFKMLMAGAKARRLNPLLRQIWFVQRWDNQKKRMVWADQVSIDGLRAVAQRTGLYDGQDEPTYEYGDDGVPTKATVKVYRKDISRAFVGVAYFAEYAGKTKDGNITKMWAEKPHIMLAKCAEALGIRKGFSEDTGGLYIPEETPDRVEAEAIVEQMSVAADTPKAAVPEKLTLAVALERIEACATLEEYNAVALVADATFSRGSGERADVVKALGRKNAALKAGSAEPEKREADPSWFDEPPPARTPGEEG